MKVFISYRRADMGGHAAGLVGRIYDKLAQKFQSENVFLDVDTIPPGVDFVEHLSKAVAKTDVLLAVIGPEWAKILAEKANKGENDYVKAEVEAALGGNIPVVPLLVGGASIPTAESLHGNLVNLRRRNAYTVDSGRDFHSHVDRLVEELETYIGSNSILLQSDGDRSEPESNSIPLKEQLDRLVRQEAALIEKKDSEATEQIRDQIEKIIASVNNILHPLQPGAMRGDETVGLKKQIPSS